MPNGLVILNELADRLGVTRSLARRIALDYGVVPKRQQVEGVGRRQRVLVWTPAEVTKIVNLRRADGFLVKDTPT